MQTKQSIVSSVRSMLGIDKKNTKLNFYCKSIEKNGISIAIYCDEELFFDNLPIALTEDMSQNAQILKQKHHTYLYLSETFSFKNANVVIHYMKSMDSFYAVIQRQSLFFLLSAALISITLSLMFYFAMKKIYFPINNIAHELRTPLTTIQGYAQYIMLGNIGMEDIFYAGNEIHREALYINNIIDRLLAMNAIQHEKISLKKVSLPDLFQILQRHYPDIVIQNEMDYVIGDDALLLCLLINLISNISRTEGEIHIIASQSDICIHNKKDYIDERLLQILNKNRSVPKNKIQGKGIGVPLCHEIVKIHRGTLLYVSTKEHGTVVTITFPPV
ncbi:MAG: HAMP domain-containing histidine kinase [Lachnospiraceae bacterium]|nr:HAMP domain-containing histidine kinase [Lachnospiraceae bacterium]